MIRGIIAWSLKFRLLAVALALGMIVIGINQVRNMPVDALPEFAPPYVEVQTEAPGLSAPEVEELVTLNLEELMNGTPWLQSIRSTSVPGLSSITLIFRPGTDIIRARQLVSERLGLAYALPNVSQPPVIVQPMSATNRAMMIGLSSKSVSPIEMSVLARWNIRPALLSVPGVANVTVWGMRDRQLQVQVDPQKLQAQHVTLDQIVSTTGNALWVSPLTFLNASTPGSGGFIDTPQQRIEVRHVLPISTPNDLAQVNVEGTKLRLGDVASVVEDHQPLIGDDIIDNGPGLQIVIEKFPGANTLDVTRGIEAKLNELRPGLSGIQIDTTAFRPASFVEMAIGNPTRALLIGLLLLALLLASFYHWRLALISLVVIPASLAAAGLVLYLRGGTINMMVLAGLVIAVGVVVDDAIIDVENIMWRLRQHRQGGSDRSTVSIILEALLQTRSPMIYASLIILLVMLPVFLLEGVSGSFLQPLALTYALALLASMLIALIVTPALCLLLLSRGPLDYRESSLLRWLQRRYKALLERIIRTVRPAFLTTSVIAVSVIALIGLAVLPSLRGLPLLPSFKEPDITIQWESPPGTSYPEMARITGRASNELRSIPGVRSVSANIGRAVLGDQIVDVNSAEFAVNVDTAAHYDATVASIQRVVSGYPGLFHVVQTYLKEKTREVQTGSGSDIVVRIFGSDLNVLRNKAEEVKQTLSQIDGTADVHTELQVEQPQVNIEVNLAKAQLYGLKPGDVRRAASTLVAGIDAGSLFEDQKVFQVVVWGTPNTRHSLSSIQDLLIDTPNGGQVHLGDVAAVNIAPTPNLIQHETVSRRIDVSLNVRGRDPSAVASDIKQSLQRIKFPLEYRAEVLGGYQEQQAAQVRLLGVGIAAALLIFLLLQVGCGGSWRLASVIFLTLPSALFGGVLMAFVTSNLISLAALFGLFAVFGIATRNCILLIKHYLHLERHEGEPFGPELVLRGAQERFAPILITSLATGLVLTPLVISGSIPGQEIVHPMAIVILGGLATSTVLNLFIIPALYLGFGPRSSLQRGMGSVGVGLTPAQALASEEMADGLPNGVELAPLTPTYSLVGIWKKVWGIRAGMCPSGRPRSPFIPIPKGDHHAHRRRQAQGMEASPTPTPPTITKYLPLKGGLAPLRCVLAMNLTQLGGGRQMWHRHRWVIAVLIISSLLSACTLPPASSANNSGESDTSEPAKVERLGGTGLGRLTLTAEAAKRLGIQTTPVSDMQIGETQQKVVPYAAVFYDLHGATWVYTNPAPFTFVRGSININSIDGDWAILSAGPPSGTAVVTVGAPELYGTEFPGGLEP